MFFNSDAPILKRKMFKFIGYFYLIQFIDQIHQLSDKYFKKVIIN
jgi:hypothetical protein